MLSCFIPSVQSARMLIALGLPTETTTIDYDETHIHAATVPIPCTYERSWPSVAGLHSVRITLAQARLLRALDLDGMSGGAIFSIDGNTGDYVANFRGAILRGGHTHLHYMDVAALRRMFEKFQLPQDSPSTRSTST
jgi:hypothetical protein